ncbi:hypothetical protein [Vibrio parahaemolyticus]|uniref:hypothetical protein n=1 Tax=Vibrio parahaemolyticus TaxID=670 RepID=UPI00038E34F4|nr:hypothetical protein [Vibrio parahaemolyticus]EQM04936.1 hypothetical protein D045_1635 [Vibrio parahaemolyticus VP-NY4]
MPFIPYLIAVRSAFGGRQSVGGLTHRLGARSASGLLHPVQERIQIMIGGLLGNSGSMPISANGGPATSGANGKSAAACQWAASTWAARVCLTRPR